MIEHLLHFGGWYLLAAIGLGFFFALFLSSLRKAASRPGPRSAAQGWSGRAAEELLAEHGYRVVDAHLAASLQGRAGGSRFTRALHADFLVERRGRRYVALLHNAAEEKQTAAPAHQTWLEHQLAFRCDGVLLVDVSRFALEEVIYEVSDHLPRLVQRAARQRRHADWTWNQATVESLREQYATARNERDRAAIAGQLRSLGEPLG